MLETIKKKSSKNEECFDRLISRLNMSKERFSGLKDMSIEMSQTEKQKKKKKKLEHQEMWDILMARISEEYKNGRI